MRWVRDDKSAVGDATRRVSLRRERFPSTS